MPRSDRISSPSLPEAASERTQVFTIAAAVVRQARLIVWCGLVLAMATSVFLLVRPRVYTSRSSFVPVSRKSPNAMLSGLAAQLGVNVPGADPTMGPAFFAELVRSREVLGPLVDAPLEVAGEGGTRAVQLAEAYRVKASSPALRRAKTIDELRDDVVAKTSTKTGMITVAVTMKDPALAATVNTRILAVLDSVNREMRVARASAERRFNERRLDEARSDLRAAEDRLTGFLATNRMYQASPGLRSAYDRLVRAVSMNQQIYVSLVNAFEQARMDELRDTPDISIVERPELPARPDSRFLVVRALLAFLAGALLGLLAGLVREALATARRAEPEAYDEFAAARRRAAAELRTGPGPFGRLFRRAGSDG